MTLRNDWDVNCALFKFQLRQLDIEIARAEVTKGNVIDTCVMSSSRLLYSSIQQFSSRARALSLLEVNVKLYDGSFS